MIKHILYLASGSSRRFGSNKLLYLLEGKPMYRCGLEMLRELVERRQDCTLTVVSRYPEIQKFAQCHGIRVVDSPDSEKGVSYTIRAGLESLGTVAAEDYVLFVVADQPWLTAASVERLLDRAGEGVLGASLCWGNRPGNPTLFAASLIPELLGLDGDTGGRAVLKRHPCVFVSAGAAKELEDMDIPQ